MRIKRIKWGPSSLPPKSEAKRQEGRTKKVEMEKNVGDK